LWHLLCFAENNCLISAGIFSFTKSIIGTMMMPTKKNYLLSMLKCLYLVLLFAFVTPLPAQSVEFAPAGSVWTYFRYTGFFGPLMYDTITLKRIEDQVVNGVNCKQFIGNDAGFYCYQTDDRIYHTLSPDEPFTLLWDFGVMPGDTFVSVRGFFSSDTMVYVCIGRDTVIENGILLPRIDLVRYCSFYDNWSETITVNPLYGPMLKDNCPGFLFSTYNECIIDFYHGFSLISYNFNTFNINYNCGFSSTQDKLPDLERITAAPNPSNGLIQLNNLPVGATVQVFDVLGRLLTGMPVFDAELDLSACPNGLYFVQVESDNRPKITLCVRKE
jgi:Secretion system C-terminal sorting domain